MAFSASRNYTESYTAANLIERALARIGIHDAIESVDSNEETDALVVLNLLVKEWKNFGVTPWTRKTGHLFLPDPGTVSSYTFGTSGSGLFTQQYYVTTLASDGAASATTLTVTDDTNMSDTDVILVENDDGTLTDTTINGTPSANSVTLTAGLDSAASAGNIVYSWPTTDSLSDRIAEIIYVARRLTNTDNAATDAGYMEGIDTPVNMIGEDDYRRLSTKLQTGAPVSVHFRDAPVNPELSVWPTGGTDNHHSLVIEYVSYLQDLDATTNNIDLPPEGVNPLVWQLAADLGPEYGLSIMEQDRIDRKAEKRVNAFIDAIGAGDVTFVVGYGR